LTNLFGDNWEKKEVKPLLFEKKIKDSKYRSQSHEERRQKKRNEELL
jgi:hypothetical protein